MIPQDDRAQASGDGPDSPNEEAAWQLAIAQFDRREFYACHDTLEAIWNEALEPQRTFYQGVLQIAVAYYHLRNHNWRGAVMLLGEGLKRLAYYAPDYYSLDVATLMAIAQKHLDHLHQLGPEQVTQFPLAEIPSLPRVT